MTNALIVKLYYDLWKNKARTFQVVMLIALGAIGIGLVIGGRNLISATVADQWQQAEPPNIKLSVNPPLTDEQLRAMNRIDGVYQVEGILSAPVEWRLGDSGSWQTAQLESRDDFRNQQMELISLISGEWPSRNRLGVIQSSDSLFGVDAGDTIQIRVGDREFSYPLTGVLKPVGPFPVVVTGGPIFYADRDTFARITGRNTYNLVMTRDQVFTREGAEATDLEIQAYFEDIGVDSFGVLFPFQSRIVPPEVPPSEAILNALFLILGLIGALIIVLAIFLVNNSISAIINQQMDQIGVMKAIGARSSQVLWSYGTLVLAYGIMAALVAVPVGGLAARGLQLIFIGFLNMDDPGFTFDRSAVLVQVAIAFLAPVAAGWFPLRQGIAITVREAINSYGLNGAVGLLDRLVARIRSLPYSTLLMISNAFRNRRRVFFIELTLVVAGTIFMMVLGIYNATEYTFGDKLQGIHNYQVTLRFDELHRSTRIERMAQAQPGVADTEMWLVTSGQVRPISQEDKEVSDPRITVFGQPLGTKMYLPEIEAGRWLAPGDRKAVVLHRRLAEITGWNIGDWITLADASGRESDWQVVGITYDPAINTSIYVPLNTLQRELGRTKEANTLWVQTSAQDAGSQEAIAGALATLYERRDIEVSPRSTFGERTISGIVESTGEGYGIIINLLAIMALIIAIVGGVGLSGVLTLSVLERRREIGVMRSIGASNWRVIRLFVGEGILLGMLSWIVALPLSVPAAYFMATKGLSLALNQQLAYRFSPNGPAIWLVLVVLLAIFASVLPARSAARVSVRESLSYQ